MKKKIAWLYVWGVRIACVLAFLAFIILAPWELKAAVAITVAAIVIGFLLIGAWELYNFCQDILKKNQHNSTDHGCQTRPPVHGWDENTY